jgi:hypothetical protein
VKVENLTLARPAGFAFAYLGSGLDSVIDAQERAHTDCVAKNGPDACSFTIDGSALITTELLIAFVALGAVSLIPVVIKKFKAQ